MTIAYYFHPNLPFVFPHRKLCPFLSTIHVLQSKKVNVYLPSLMMKVPNHLNLNSISDDMEACCCISKLRFNLYCLTYFAFFCFSASCGSEDVDVYCCISNLRFILYCFAYSAFLCFLTASMPVSAILVTRHEFNTIL
jgi:hypothetical protein